MDSPKRNVVGGLPDEAMLEILSRAPFRSVCRSKCVAKAWRDLIDDPLNRIRLPQTLQGFFSLSPSSVRDGSSDYQHFFIKYLASLAPLDIDPCLSFLTKLPKTECVTFEDSCNGLLLFGHYPKSEPDDVLSYIVCNPATKHWATVPKNSACCSPPKTVSQILTYLAFDPARPVSPHFHLIQLPMSCWDELKNEEITEFELSVYTYSSESGVWSHRQTDWNEQGQLEGWRRQGSLTYGCDKRAFVNGILHLIVFELDQLQIAAVDVKGKTKRIINVPDAAEGRQWFLWPWIGQSQGCLHYINSYHDYTHVEGSELTIWVLQDYDTQEWVLKDTVSFLQLFGRTNVRRAVDYDIVAIHPDCNVVFFLQSLNRLIAYDMDRKEVSVVFMPTEKLKGWMEIVPYIPYFSESPPLTNKD